MSGFASRGLLISAGLILTTVLALPWLWPPGESSAPSPAAPVSSAQPKPVAQAAVAPAKPADVQAWIAQEAIQIGMLQENPDESMARLRDKAAKISSEEIRALEALALENGREGDRRFLAVELLTMSETAESARALERIAVSSRPPRGLEPQLETALRARALEGLGSHRSGLGQELLHQSLSRLDESFLLDRAQRALLSAQGSVRSPERQDQEALERLLGVDPSENETR